MSLMRWFSSLAWDFRQDGKNMLFVLGMKNHDVLLEIWCVESNDFFVVANLRFIGEW